MHGFFIERHIPISLVVVIKRPRALLHDDLVLRSFSCLSSEIFLWAQVAVRSSSGVMVKNQRTRVPGFFQAPVFIFLNFHIEEYTERGIRGITHVYRESLQVYNYSRVGMLDEVGQGTGAEPGFPLSIRFYFTHF
jgi:hypothetical protein